MKKLISILAIITFATSGAWAATCEELGHSGSCTNGEGPTPYCCADGTCLCRYRTCGTLCKCVNGVCPAPTSCPSGQYISGTNCVACPTYNDGAGGTTTSISSASPYARTNCYIATTVDIADTVGTYSFSSNCNYSL